MYVCVCKYIHKYVCMHVSIINMYGCSYLCMSMFKICICIYSLIYACIYYYIYLIRIHFLLIIMLLLVFLISNNLLNKRNSKMKIGKNKLLTFSSNEGGGIVYRING